MARLIDADALIETFRRGFTSDVANAVASVINDEPTVDAAPVVHGRWKHVKKKFRSDELHCSNCDSLMPINFNYCPNCGAKMDGGRHDP